MKKDKIEKEIVEEADRQYPIQLSLSLNNAFQNGAKWLFNDKINNQKTLRIFKYTLKNTDVWAITDHIMVVVANSKIQAKQMLNKSGYDVKKTSELIELKQGIHFIQQAITE